MQRNLIWHHPAWYLLLLMNALVYIVAALIVRKRGTLQIGVCSRHRSMRTRGIIIGWGGGLTGMVGGIACPIAISSADAGMAGFGLGLLLFLISLVAAILMTRLVVPERIDRELIRVRVGQPFLESLPHRG